jgi:lysophospholipase L1-like esterase
MKKVLLLGDSIRINYQDLVKEKLEGRAEVVSPESNCAFAKYTLCCLGGWLRELGTPDIVHWNNGYWDMNIEAPMETALYPVDEYSYLLRRIVREIRKNGAKVIFATTTPILDAGTAADNTGTGALSISYNDTWVREYNEAAKKVMAEENVPVNDLYALCKEDKNYYKCPDMLHLTEEGYRRCAEQAVEMILKELEEA